MGMGGSRRDRVQMCDGISTGTGNELLFSTKEAICKLIERAWNHFDADWIKSVQLISLVPLVPSC